MKTINKRKEVKKDEEQELIFKAIEKNKNPEVQSKLLYINTISQEREEKADEAEKEQKLLFDQYDQSYTNIYHSINDIVFGKNQNITLTEEEEKKYGINSSESNTNEIKDYWKKVIYNANYFHFDDEDKKIFSNLINVTYDNLKKGFKVSFIFQENEFFEPTTLCKEYYYNNQGEQIIATKATEINWKKEELKNKVNSKQNKSQKGKTDNQNKKEKKDKFDKGDFSEINFFSIFKSMDNIDKKYKEEDKKEYDEEFEEKLVLIDDEVDFFKNDLFKNQLEYYLNIMDICDERVEEEFEEEGEYDDNYYTNNYKDNYNNNYKDNYKDNYNDNYNDNYYGNNYRERRNYGSGGYRRGRGGYYNNYNNYDDYDDNDDYDDYDDYNYNYYERNYNYRGGRRTYGRGGNRGKNFYRRNYY